jgi:Fic family protein
MDPNTFQSQAAGQLIKVEKGKASYWAFNPNPLPPEIRPDWALTGALSQADRAVSELAGLGLTLPNPAIFIHPFVRREAVLSSRIEGTQSDLADLYLYEGQQLMLPGMPLDEPAAADVREVFNYVRALEYGLERLSTLPLSLRLMREIHLKLMQGVRGQHAAPGEFRATQNWIGGATLNQAAFVPPPVELMQVALDQFEKYLHADDRYPPIIRLALIHYQFECMHPFIDGNGRIGRLLLSLLLVHWKLLPVPLLHLSAYFEQRRQKYYDLLLAVSQRGAWEEWVAFFLEGVRYQAHDTAVRLRRLLDLRGAWNVRLRDARASGSAMRLMDLIFEAPILTIPQAQHYLNVTYHPARKAVERLIELGILAPLDQSAYDRKFIAREVFEAIVKE